MKTPRMSLKSARKSLALIDRDLEVAFSFMAGREAKIQKLAECVERLRMVVSELLRRERVRNHHERDDRRCATMTPEGD